MTILILAAGSAARMGRQKLLLPIDGRTIVERVVRAAEGWPTVVVTSNEVAPSFGPTALCVVRNDAPERGMAHSLKLGNHVVPAGEPIAVLLGDLPDITPAAIGAVIAAYDDTVDVVIPRIGERYVHPIVFGPAARGKIAGLPDGDTIKRLRDDPQLRRRFVEGAAEGLTDIDTPDDYARRVAGSAGQIESSP